MTLSAQKPFRRLAIVNRGEAAMRCIRTAKALRLREGSELAILALFTEVDREAPFVGSVGMAFCASFFQDGHDFMGKVDFVGISGGFDQAD